MGSFITLGTIQTALELGVIYSLVALALFLSFSMLNVCDLSTDSCFTLGCAVGSMVAIASPTLRQMVGFQKIKWRRKSQYGQQKAAANQGKDGEGPC